jgi:dihydrofolate synthase/folylpolyglutamate synthase
MPALADWLARQERAHARSIDLTLDRVRTVATRLALGRPECPTFIVGGTNGKGSTVAWIDGLLRRSGVRSGAFTSPHLVCYNERITVDGEPVSDDELVTAFERIEAARDALTLTFFEYNTLAALAVFRERNVGAIVLEVGLGGRLDATNLVDADVAVLCSVGLDHTEWLGPTRADIGREKAGIFRAGRPVVLATGDMPASVFEAIDALGARAWVSGRDFTVVPAGDDHWSLLAPPWRFEDLPPPSMPGLVQRDNAAAAIVAVCAAGLVPSPQAVRRTLREVMIPGRFQVVPGDVEWIVDVAHNEPAAAVLAAALATRPAHGRTIAVAGFLADKDVAAIGRRVAGVVDAWVLATLPPPRGLDAADVARHLNVEPLAVAADVASACRLARAGARRGDRIVAFGSFLVAGPVLEWLGLYSA